MVGVDSDCGCLNQAAEPAGRYLWGVDCVPSSVVYALRRTRRCGATSVYALGAGVRHAGGTKRRCRERASVLCAGVLDTPVNCQRSISHLRGKPRDLHRAVSRALEGIRCRCRIDASSRTSGLGDSVCVGRMRKICGARVIGDGAYKCKSFAECGSLYFSVVVCGRTIDCGGHYDVFRTRRCTCVLAKHDGRETGEGKCRGQHGVFENLD